MNINNIKDNKVIVKTSNIKQIKIPMIQRDYVQSLDDTKFNNFLNVLVSALQNNETISLDFIYGNINEDGVFEPIDGQQRLTTLALLTFYLYCRQSKNILQNPFEYITYATRQSANNFCLLLKNNNWKDKFNNNDKPSNIIKNDNNLKYFKEYDEDITISSMLKALDKIHERIGNLDIDALAEKIINISFHIFPMESFNLSDDLYIKMNGRGKQLSNFDNFKAEYFKWLESTSNIEELIPDSLGDEPQKRLETLKRKFDTDYIDIFWNYAMEISTQNIPDPENLFFRFINKFVIDKYFVNSKKNNDNKIDNGDIIKQIDNNSIDYKNHYFNILKDYNYQLVQILEFLSLIKHEDLFQYMKPNWEYDNLNIQKIFMGTNTKLKDRIILHSVFTYLEHMLSQNKEYVDINNFNKNNNFSHLMRYVWNIVENNNNLDADSRILDFIDKLDRNYYHNNIYEKSIYEIASSNIDEDTFVVKQENIKAQKIFNNKNEDWEQMFIKIEKHQYFKGDIYFLIKDIDNTSIDTFNKRAEMVAEIFSENQLNQKFLEDNIFIRGIMGKFSDIDFTLLSKYSYLDDSFKGEHGFLNNYSHIINPLLDNHTISDMHKELVENTKVQSMITQSYKKIIHEILYRDETKLLNKLIKNKNGYIRTFHNCKINLWGCTSPKGSSSKKYICIDIIKSGIIGRLQKQYDFKIIHNINCYTIEYFNETFSFYENFPNRTATFKSKKYPHIELEIANFKYSYEGDVHWNGIIIKNNDVKFEHKIDYDKYMNEITNISLIINNEINTIINLF